MTFFNIFNNLNTSSFSLGLNTGTNWFSPSFGLFDNSALLGSSFSMPFVWNSLSQCNFSSTPMFNFSGFNFSNMFNWNSSLFSNFSNNSCNNLWNSPFNTSFSTGGLFSNNIWSSCSFTSTASGIGDNFSITNKNKTKFSLANYDAKAGEKLASTALKNSSYVINKGTNTITSKHKNQGKAVGLCATYVKASIRDAGLGGYVSGHAYQMTSILRKNSNFKEISPSSVNVKDLPSGCILVYNRGAQGYSSAYGHTEITTGDGRAVSDFVNNNLYKTPSAIFVPVTA